MYFDELNISDELLDALDAMNFEECTPIQEQAIPKILEGHDLMGIAQTGTGKTAAYLLPVLDELSHGNYPKDSVNCIIMSPTRELAQQIDQQVEGFAYYLDGVSSVAVYGGNDGIRFEQERKGLELGADIIIATPGRLISHLNGGHIDLKKVSFFILDEADRMLDMGFYDDIMKIASYLSADRQTIMFSATMPDNIQKLAQNILRNPVEVKIAVSKPAEKIQQIAYICYDGMKERIVEQVLSDETLDRVILFASSKQKVKELSLTLKRKGFNVGAMHSDLAQREREEMMLGFKNRRIRILIATDIVSRGIDIDDIQMVINFDTPRDPEDYVHRIGRTARANRDGQAVTLVTPKDWPHLMKIEKLIEKEIPKPDLPEGCGEKPEISASSRRHTPGRHGGKGRHHRKGNGKHRSKNKNKSSNQGEKA
ncbi:MAG: DEAD/DEAH box helicase [Bacteroidaceae bacterium]|jgi:superfamily II DNA/RNA helicase|nr:DEAD/DEAH box helicase [Bacteroidaceae bacterium]MBR3618912.1 DEAD/DEAH box helicase [Bacteroidaceae bacterium]